MFRCDNCGSGYSARSASIFDSCPRCLARERIDVPLSFELGWRGSGGRAESATGSEQVKLADGLPLTRRPLREDAEVEAGDRVS